MLFVIMTQAVVIATLICDAIEGKSSSIMPRLILMIKGLNVTPILAVRAGTSLES